MNLLRHNCALEGVDPTTGSDYHHHPEIWDQESEEQWLAAMKAKHAGRQAEPGSCKDWLRRGLNVLLGQMAECSAPDNTKVPELFSGNCRSPLWFIGENPAGRGERPSLGPVREDWHAYTDFYLNRFQNLPHDINGDRLSKVNQNYVAYAQAFCDAAGSPRAQLGEVLMKTNAFGIHAPNEYVLQGITNPYPLAEWVRHLIEVCRPAYVVGIGRAADDVIQTLQRGVGADGATEFFSFRSCPNWRRSRECMELMRRLGEKWGRGKGSPPSGR